ncbi:MAG TPA: transcriptional repressor [Syntrophomonadaceae bacterium]|nr:transcriptional repressor [Syntrophomonadaceae bacterium]
MAADTKNSSENKRTAISEKLNRLGLKATPQRLAILELLDGNTSHPSAEEIYRRLKPVYPSLSLATVYGTMETLAKAGELQELNIDPGRKRFDPNPIPHGHFFCQKCQRVYDIELDFPMLEVPGELGEFLAESYSVNLYGLCPGCRKKGRENAWHRGDGDRHPQSPAPEPLDKRS